MSPVKAAKYETQKPSTCRATLFRCKFSLMFPVFHLVWSTCRATKTFVARWRKLLRKVERGSTLALLLIFQQTHNLSRNKFARALANQPISAPHFFNPQQCFCCATSGSCKVKNGNIVKNLQRNNDTWQVDGFCISYFAALNWAGSISEISLLFFLKFVCVHTITRAGLAIEIFTKKEVARQDLGNRVTAVDQARMKLPKQLETLKAHKPYLLYGAWERENKLCHCYIPPSSL